MSSMPNAPVDVGTLFPLVHLGLYNVVFVSECISLHLYSTCVQHMLTVFFFLC